MRPKKRLRILNNSSRHRSFIRAFLSTRPTRDGNKALLVSEDDHRGAMCKAGVSRQAGNKTMKPSQIRRLAIARATPAVNHVHNDEMERIRHCRIGRVKVKRCAVMAEIALMNLFFH